MIRTALAAILLMPLLLAAQEKSRLKRLEEITGTTIHGFADYRYGQRLMSDDYEGDGTLNEPRFQLLMNKDWQDITFQFRGDLVYNAHEDDREKVDLERGEGFFDLRELYASLQPLDWMDLKVGRQILTWGTGDLIFINDLFPKDWQSFFLGRDDEYLKAPSDAIFASMFFDSINVDIALTPRFDPDRYITGEHISYYSPGAGSHAGSNAVMDPDRPNDWFRDYELAIRAYKNISGYEVAAYAYDGFWKSPGGVGNNGRPIFPDLRVYGASARGTLGKGIANAEIGYYDSLDDQGGTNPFINNSEFRALVGFQQDVAKDFNVGIQYYLEWMMDYGDYHRNLPAGMPTRDEFRHLTTIRFTKLLMNQNLRLSLFAFYSPSDNDTYIRPQVSYKQSDALRIFAGANWFGGEDQHTFFNQFEHNSNAYVGVRYSF